MKRIKGFSYTLENEKIKEYMKLTTEQKLEWLEEIIIFTEMLLTPKQKKIREKLRKGDV